MEDYVSNNGIVVVDSSINSDYTPNADAYEMVGPPHSQQQQLQENVPVSESLLTSQRLGRHNNLIDPKINNNDEVANNPEIIRLGNGQIPRVSLPDLEEMEEYLLPLGYTVQHVLKFIDLYTANCTVINF